MSWFCWLSRIQPIVLITSLSHILSIHNCIAKSVVFSDIKLSHTKSDQIWSSIQWSSDKSLPTAQETRNKRDGMSLELYCTVVPLFLKLIHVIVLYEN